MSVYLDDAEWQRHLHELREWREKTGGEVVGGTLILEPAEFTDPTHAAAILEMKLTNFIDSLRASAVTLARQRGWMR